MVAQGVLWILLGLLLRLEPGTATLPLLMDSVIQALAELEQKVPATKASHVASAWLLLVQDSGPRDLLHHFLLERQNLKATNLDPHQVSPELRALTKDMAQHGIRDRQEYGVVLAPDGSTVAVEPLLAGLEAGLQGRRVVNLPLDTTDLDVKPTSTGIRPGSPDVPVTSPDVHTSLPGAKARSPTTVDSLLVVTLARDLGLSFLQGPQTWSHAGLGTEGCWDQLSAPRTFTLLHSGTSPVTMAFLNGALDGVLLGDYLSRTPEPRPPLSHLLSEYYGAGVAGDPGFRSNFRRQNTAALTSTPTLTQQGARPSTPVAAGAPRPIGAARGRCSCHSGSCTCITHTFPRHPARISRTAPPTCALCSTSTRIPGVGTTLATGNWGVRKRGRERKAVLSSKLVLKGHGAQSHWRLWGTV
uniref:Peptidoglycan recognition protein 2 n=1 Tax=Canis lupus dingo TaxID=286419 RepID=A0A8C0K989_CANLU